MKKYNTMKNLLRTLIEDFNYSKEKAKEEIQEARELINEYLQAGDIESAHEICAEMWGLEPDYLMDLI